MQDFFDQLAELLEVDDVRPEDELRQFATWDSLTALSVFAMIATDYNLNLDPTTLSKITTAGELWEWVQSMEAVR
ncbi:MAG: phosphopantetheine-binding protein [Armatimonadota bacterium]